jgi:ApbE superfamily uncharacterized protein (UPF0280 family)
MSNDLSKQLHSVNKQLAAVGPASQAAKFLGVTPLAAVAAVVAGSTVAFMLIFDIMTGLI